MASVARRSGSNAATRPGDEASKADPRLFHPRRRRVNIWIVETARPRRDGRRSLAWGLWGFTLLLLVAAFTLGTLNGTEVDAQELITSAIPILAVGTSSTVGALVASRQPANAIGWLLLLFPAGLILGILAEEYSIYALRTSPGDLPAAEWMAWVGRWAVIAAALTIPLILLLFPTGTPPSPRWRWLQIVLITSGAAVVAITAVDPRHVTLGVDKGLPTRAGNPIGIDALEGVVNPALAITGTITLVAAIACFAGLILRFRRAEGDERQQLRWLAFVGSVAVGIIAVMFVVDRLGGRFADAMSAIGDVLWMVLIASLAVGIPVACGIAILKFHLYDLDVVIKKTVVFAVLAGAVALVYVIVVIVLGTAVSGDAGVSGTFFAAVALLSLALQPLRSWAGRLADRLVYGRRATPYEVLSRFTERLGDVSSADDVAPRMAQLITEGTGARNASVWLRLGPTLRREAAWPVGAGGDVPELPMADGNVPDIPGSTTAIPMTHRGEVLGAIALDVPPSDPLTPDQERLLGELATQAGLALRNVALTADLRRRLEELERSRKRLVTAQDEERRRLERNLHDGAQQQLVAIGVRLRLADQMIDRDPTKAHEMLAAVQVESQEAIEALRDLARGIYPPVLADRGLAAALEAQARKSHVPVELRDDGLGRYGQEVEAAAYFCVLEALQNVAKYAEASRVIVTLAHDDGSLRFEVSDDGAGFDPSTVAKGSGLQNMEDRLAAVGGTLTVESAPGRGTTVIGRIPATPVRD
jgi:signal transduction histidine kinase